MKIQILNDLHIEFLDYVIPKTDADVIVLAGDIGIGLEGLEWLHEQEIEKPVIYVLGNHEFYHHDISLIDELKKNAKPNIHVLNNSHVTIDGVRFLGCTLWTDFDYFGEAEKNMAMGFAKSRMADFSTVSYKGEIFSPQNSIELHNESRDWLNGMLGESYPGKSVVVTHHAPSALSVHPRYAKDLLTPAFVSSLEHLMDERRVALWIHGHMHDAVDYEVHGTRVICNPRGYVRYERDTGFNPELVVEVL